MIRFKFNSIFYSFFLVLWFLSNTLASHHHALHPAQSFQDFSVINQQFIQQSPLTSTSQEQSCGLCLAFKKTQSIERKPDFTFPFLEKSVLKLSSGLGFHLASISLKQFARGPPSVSSNFF